MIRGWVMLTLSIASLLAPGMPTGTAVSMALAALTGLAATRLHERGEWLVANDRPEGPGTVRRARLCDDGAVALCVLAVLYAVTAAV